MNEFLRRILFLPAQGSTVAYEVDSLHYFVILTTMGGAVLVTLVGGYFLIRYRQRNADLAGPFANAGARPLFPVKAVALIGLAGLFLVWWVLGFREYIRIRVAPSDAMEVYVTAKQWMWKFAYSNGARSIDTLYVPAGRPVKLIMTSRDVIHSFFVPDFRVKQDVLPGRYTTLWFAARQPGSYPVLCTQYCGTGHSTMRAEVVAMRPADFDRWLAGSAPAGTIAGPKYVAPSLGLPGEAAASEPLSLVREGERVAAAQGCLRCHTVDGAPHIGPTWAGLWYSLVPLEGGGQIVADEAYLTEAMMDPNAKIHRGYSAVMPGYLGRLQPSDTAAILEFIKSLRDVPPEPVTQVPQWAAPPPASAIPSIPPPVSVSDAQGRGRRLKPPAAAPPGGLIPILDGGISE